jgi:hypothetical protein
VRFPDAVKLIVSIIAVDTRQMDTVIGQLEEHYGMSDVVGVLHGFHYTDYYAPEMGSALIRRFLSFRALVRPELLPEIKTATNRIEDERSEQARRQVNLDPGYISAAHLILATGKGYTHRPYLRRGIYADLTLAFRDKTFHPLPWTYPDYADARQISFFNRIRQRYITQLRQGEGRELRHDVWETGEIGQPSCETNIIERY